MKTALKEGEELVLVTRKHLLSLWMPITANAFSIAIGIVLAPFSGGLSLLFPAVTLLWLAYKVVERKHNLWAVTNYRIIDEEGLFSIETKESPLDKINNVSYSATIAGRILGFGDVEIQTAAETGSTLYQMVENPKKLKDSITQMQEEYKSLSARRQAKEMADSLGQYMGAAPIIGGVAKELEKLAELHQKGLLDDAEFKLAKEKLLKS